MPVAIRIWVDLIFACIWGKIKRKLIEVFYLNGWSGSWTHKYVNCRAALSRCMINGAGSLESRVIHWYHISVKIGLISGMETRPRSIWCRNLELVLRASLWCLPALIHGDKHACHLKLQPGLRWLVAKGHAPGFLAFGGEKLHFTLWLT